MIALDPRHPLLWTMPSVCSPEECEALVARIEAARPAPAPVTTAAGTVMRPDIRNNTRVVFDDAPLAELLLDRVRSTLPASMLGMHLSGANDAFLDAEKVIAPAMGTALLFQHHLLHEGRVVRSGVKYVLRTDVMYRSPSAERG